MPPRPSRTASHPKERESLVGWSAWESLLLAAFAAVNVIPYGDLDPYPARAIPGCNPGGICARHVSVDKQLGNGPIPVRFDSSHVPVCHVTYIWAGRR